MIRIVIIDDERDVREALQEVLGRAGFQVDVAASGDQGLALLRQRPGDVVITDIIMPGRDGVEMISEIRKEFPATKIIAISGGGNVTPLAYEPKAIKTEAYLASATAAGADMTLTKPFDGKELIQALHDLTGETSAD